MKNVILLHVGHHSIVILNFLIQIWVYLRGDDDVMSDYHLNFEYYERPSMCVSFLISMRILT